MTAASIRKARPSDAAEIGQLLQTTWLATYINEEYDITKEDILSVGHTSAKQIEKYRKKIASREDAEYWVAEISSKIVGTCAARKEKSWNRIMAIYVLPEYQSNGIGSLMLEAALDWLGDKKSVRLAVTAYNTSTVLFYKTFGFVEDGPVHDYPSPFASGKDLPAIWMVKKSTHIEIHSH